MISQSCHFAYKEQHIMASYEVTIVPLFSLPSYMIAQFLALSVGLPTATILAEHGNHANEIIFVSLIGM